MTVIVLGAALCSIAALVAGGHLVRRRRVVLGPLLVVAGVVGLVVGDVVPRQVATRELVTDCLTASVEPVSSPLAWQAATGGVLVDARVAPEVVSTMVADRLSGTPFADADVRLAADAVEVDGQVDSRLGRLDVTVEVRPEVADDRLTWSFGSILVGGQEVPPALASRILQSRGQGADGVGGSGCGSGGLGGGSVRAAEVDPSGLSVRIAL